MSVHVLITKETCPCDKRSGQPCNVCDGGLAICSQCGKAEMELDEPCLKKRRYSYSQISTYASCPTLFKFRYQDHLQAHGESEHDLRFGKAWDSAMNVLYLPERLISRARSAFSISYPESEYPIALPYWSSGKSFQSGLDGITEYAEKYEDEDRNWQVISIQSRDKTETDDGDSRTVVLDLVVRDRRDGLIYGVDNKSTGKYLNSDYWLQFDPHSQIRQYVDHLQRKYGECGGFYINAAGFMHRKKTTTPWRGPNKGITLPAGDWRDFKRMVFNPNQEAVQAERNNFSSWVRKIEADRESGQWGYNTNYCKRGPIICPYHKICSSGWTWPKDAQLIEAHYQQRCPLIIQGERCWLQPEHEGECDPTRSVVQDGEVEFDDEIEEAQV